MEQRKGDVRVYVVSGLFFSCIITGGVFLSLYIFLPETQTSNWYPIAGMVLVAIPWAFWFFTYVYRCFKPNQPPPQPENSIREAAPSTVATTTMANPSTNEEHSPMGGGERRVQFGPVIVMGSNDDSSREDGIPVIHENPNPNEVERSEGESRSRENEGDHDQEISNSSRESEVPLRLSVS
ncbi:hypothetical protein UlMin_004870 [Ulmus minor]